jgi:hypothetical protein
LVSNVRDKLDNQDHEGTEALIEVKSVTADKETLNQQLRDLQQQMTRLVVGPEAVPDDVVDVEDITMFAKSDEAEGVSGTGALGAAGTPKVTSGVEQTAGLGASGVPKVQGPFGGSQQSRWGDPAEGWLVASLGHAHRVPARERTGCPPPDAWPASRFGGW